MPDRAATVRRLAPSLLAAALLAAPFSAHAGLFGSKPKPAAPATPPAAAPTPPARAGAAERAAAERLEPLARAAFWAKAVEVDPTDADAGVKLSAALRQLKRFDEASQAVERVLVLEPKNEEALLEAARAKISADQGFYALDDLNRARAVAPQDWRPLSLLGVAYQQTKRGAEAEQAWAEALKRSPENPGVLSNMALARASAGRTAEAEALLRRAVAQPQASVQERQNLALVLGMEGKLAEAESLLRQDLPPEQADQNLAYLRKAASK